MESEAETARYEGAGVTTTDRMPSQVEVDEDYPYREDCSDGDSLEAVLIPDFPGRYNLFEAIG